MDSLLVEIHSLVEFTANTKRESIHVNLVWFLMLKLDQAFQELLELGTCVTLLLLKIFH
jgi:hypothetical protein